MSEALIVRRGGKKSGLYVWKKLTAEGGDFIDFVVSDQETAYPDGGMQGGYWYELFDLKSFGIDFGEVTLASTAASVTVSHNLGVVPQTVALFSKTIPSSDTLGGTWTAIKCHDVYAFTFGSKKYEYGKVADSIYGPNYFEITDNKITFLKRGDNYPLIGEYCWVAII